MTALGTTNKLTLASRLGAPFTAGNPGIGLAEPEPTLGALDNVFELHLHEPFFWRSFIKITGNAGVLDVQHFCTPIMVFAESYGSLCMPKVSDALLVKY